MTDDEIRNIAEGLDEPEEPTDAAEPVESADVLEEDVAADGSMDAEPEPALDVAPEDAPADEPAHAETDVAVEPSADAVDAEPEAAEPAAEGLSDAAFFAALESDETLEAALAETTPAEAEPGAEAAADAPAEGAAPADAAAAVPMVDMGPEDRITRKWWFWVAIAAVVLVIAGGIYAWWYLTARPIAVPDVKGKGEGEAVQRINDAGLRLGEISSIPTDTAPVGTVIDQKPVAKTELQPDGTVNIVVAAAAETAEVPDVTGKTRDEAESAIATARLRTVAVETYDATRAAGYVISQLPSAGVELPPGSSVALAVSKGPAPAQITVPKLTGMTDADAKQLLASLQLEASSLRGINASVTAGEVYAQSPAAGAKVGLNTVVQYVVAETGSSAVTVPSVEGKKQADAEKALKDKGLKPAVTAVPSASVAKGIVISQMPPAGTKTAKGGTVGILVSKGNLPNASVPNVTEVPQASAEASLSAAGFKPTPILVKISGFTAGNVFAQFPAAGTAWPLKFPVLMLVATGPK